MVKEAKIDNKKDQKDEKLVKKNVKSSYSKKKKTKKNILNGVAYVQSTFNNTIISIADTNGNVVSWASAGQKGFKGSRKSTPYAAQIAADAAASKALEYGMKTLTVESKDQVREEKQHLEHYKREDLKSYLLKIQRQCHTMELDHQRKGEFNGNRKC